ncbi:hypothetical protein ABZ349_29750 [Streptomyces niveus]|uniref:YaaC family protein n=1 Tax=Streptomyces niveus TaxID=193462 RepID=UPI0033DF220C
MARAKTYSTALEQAQQMFRAAEVVGPQTRPLLVFYGLSQAGRAIAAAATTLKGEKWNLVSHGIHATGYHKDFADIEIRTDPAGSAGSFVPLSELLESPIWCGDSVVPLNAVRDNIPASLEYPLTAGERLTPLYAGAGIGSQPHPLLTIEVGDIPDRVVDAGSREALTEFLEAYPGTSGHDGFVIRTWPPTRRPRFGERTGSQARHRRLRKLFSIRLALASFRERQVLPVLFHRA